WQTTGIELPETARNATRSGGTHLIFRMPAGEISDFKRKVRLVKAKCDCKDGGKPKPCGVDLLVYGYAIIPPTPGYVEDPDFPLESAVIIPRALLELATERRTNENRTTGDADGKVRQGERKATACSLAGSVRARGVSIEGIRALLKADNEQRFDPPLDDAEIEDVLKSPAGGEQATNPDWELLRDRDSARRFALMHAGNVFYSAERRKWILWNGRFWQWDITGAVCDLVEQTIRGIYAEASRAKEKEIR